MDMQRVELMGPDSKCWQWRSSMYTFFGRKRLFIQMENILCEEGFRQPRAQNDAKQTQPTGRAHPTWKKGTVDERTGAGQKDLARLPTLWAEADGSVGREIGQVVPDEAYTVVRAAV